MVDRRNGCGQIYRGSYGIWERSPVSLCFSSGIPLNSYIYAVFEFSSGGWLFSLFWSAVAEGFYLAGVSFPCNPNRRSISYCSVWLSMFCADKRHGPQTKKSYCQACRTFAFEVENGPSKQIPSKIGNHAYGPSGVFKRSTSKPLQRGAISSFS